jgi:hypothetical protein
MNTLIFNPAKRRLHHKRRYVVIGAPPTALVLLSVAYEPTAALTLTFNRAIDIDAIDGSAIVVDDGVYGFRFAGAGGATLVSPTAVELLLVGVEELPFTGVHLTAALANGIVASGDEVAWAGVTDVELPFP